MMHVLLHAGRSRRGLLVAVAALSVSLLSCKREPPTEEWSRMQAGRRAGELDAIEKDLRDALDSYVASARTNEPGSRAALQQAVGRVLGSARWVTSWRPPELTSPATGGQPAPLEVPITVPHVEQGGAGQMPGRQIAPDMHLYWGLYRLGNDAFGGVEISRVVRSGDASLRVHLIVIPNKAQLPAP